MEISESIEEVLKKGLSVSAEGGPLREASDDEPHIEWSVAGAIVATVTRDGVGFNVSIQKGGGQWSALGVVSPAIDRNASIEENTEALLDTHAHKLLLVSPDLTAVMTEAQLWLLTAPVPESLCNCEEA